MRKFNIYKFMRFIIVIGIVLGCSLYIGYLNKQIIKEKEMIQAKYEAEVQRLKEENEIHAQKVAHYEAKLEDTKIEYETKVDTLVRENNELREMVKTNRGDDGEGRWEKFTITAYDLSIQSCGKKKTHPLYGITASGVDLKGQSWETARVVACDPKVIPLGSKVKIKFIDESYSVYDGIYTCADVGGAIKGKKLDFFYEDTGEKVSKNALNFGVTEAYVQIIN